MFTLGKNQPECWTYVNLKKDFLPKVNKCLKEAAYGAPIALYQNFVKFVSVCPLFQLKEIKEDKLIKKFDSSYESLVKIWKEKHARGRIGFLKKKNKVSYDTLFLDDLIYLNWEETKAKYLSQIGR